jgi:uncharacterized membrane protein
MVLSNLTGEGGGRTNGLLLLLLLLLLFFLVDDFFFGFVGVEGESLLPLFTLSTVDVAVAVLLLARAKVLQAGMPTNCSWFEVGVSRW